MRRHEWRTPLELFKGDKPDVSYFRVFGTLTYIWIHPDQWKDKLSPKSEEMIFIGYKPNTKGYRFWSQQQHWVFISTRAIFDEQVFPYCSRSKEDGPAPIPVEEENPQAIDDSSQDDDHHVRDPEPRHDILVHQPLGQGLPNQPIPPPDHGQRSGHTSPWRTPSETRRPPSFTQESQPISPLFYDTPPGDPPSSPSQKTFSYHPSPMKPARK